MSCLDDLDGFDESLVLNFDSANLSSLDMSYLPTSSPYS